MSHPYHNLFRGHERVRSTKAGSDGNPCRDYADGFGGTAFRRVEIAVMICAGANNFWIMMLSGTPREVVLVRAVTGHVDNGNMGKHLARFSGDGPAINCLGA